MSLDTSILIPTGPECLIHLLCLQGQVQCLAQNMSSISIYGTTEEQVLGNVCWLFLMTSDLGPGTFWVCGKGNQRVVGLY